MPRFSPSLSIRHKVLAALLACLAAVGFLSALSLSRLAQIENTLAVVELASDLSDTFLEARRYEKNFLLYALAGDLDEAVGFAERAIGVCDAIEAKSKSASAVAVVRELREADKAYLGSLAALRGQTGRAAAAKEFQERMRGQGKDLIERAQGLVQFERARIGAITASLRAQLLIAVSAFMVMAAALMLLVRGKIIRPLAAIEDATRRIARGEFSTIDAPRRNDETGRVLTAFDTMVRELEMRQDQLVQAKKLSSIGTLAAGIAHQLNNPLNNISTSCQLALEEFDGGDREFLLQMLGNVDKETLRARDIVRGLLEFSRDKEFAAAATPVQDVLRDSVRLASSQIPPGVEVTVDAPAGLTALMDKQKMQEVFINLIINAVQAIGDGQGFIRLSARAAPGETGDAPPDAWPGSLPGVEIRIADSGPGIPEPVRQHIFDPFFTTKEVGEGTGLGLSIVYGIVKKHGGTIELDNTPGQGQGAQFVIRLAGAAAATVAGSDKENPGAIIAPGGAWGCAPGGSGAQPQGGLRAVR
ncbi:MAG: HAMP domain-containing histidine kinase [Desulfovibrionaceae bacterium]|nr:HAMP domain-containing histidine kinase [Desulfovibrionaceae bacterium]